MSLNEITPVEITETMVYEAIVDVLDPELDESLVKLGFVDSVQVEENNVTVIFKLPTFWCAPNFAYLMAADMRAKVKEIPGVGATRILLLDHCADEEINNSVNTDKSFVEAFPDEADGDLEELRRTFLRKGFLVRQDSLLRQLQKAGVDEETILALRISDLMFDETTQRLTVRTPHQVIQMPRATRIARTYLLRAAALGIHCGADDLLFVDDEGQPIANGELQAYQRKSRSVLMNIMFNTVFCTDMFRTRYGTGVSQVVPREEGPKG
jgi:metal-sulfur cluster biosynthetic enzyme